MQVTFSWKRIGEKVKINPWKGGLFSRQISWLIFELSFYQFFGHISENGMNFHYVHTNLQIIQLY